MIRSYYALCALGFAAAATTMAGCNNPNCGPGTKSVQGAAGDILCRPVEQQAPATPCDLDGGTVDIVGGLCVSHIKCDPGTTMYDPTTGVCVGTGNGSGCAPCPNPIPAGQVCITGGVVDFQTRMHVTGGDSSRPLHIAAYEPLAFLSMGMSTPPLSEDPSTTKGCFTFTIPVPASGLVALGVQDPVGSTPASPLALGASAVPVVAQKQYKVDTYMVTKATLDSYTAVNPAFTSAGSYIACFYNQPLPAPTNLVFSETMPAAGVKLLENGVTPGAVKYLSASGTIDNTLAMTGPSGCALTPGTGNIGNYTGTGGGPARWQTEQGGTAGGVVLVSRFHSCDTTPSDPMCQ